MATVSLPLSRTGRGRRKSPLPGLSLTLGITITWLTILLLLPLVALFLKSVTLGPTHFVDAAFSRRAIASYELSFGAALAAAAVNAVFGLLVAWVLVRYRFPGRRLLSALVDLPFALPTAVAGIALTAVYANTGWVGKPASAFGLALAYNPVGVVIALTFIGLPFVVRTVEPVLTDLGKGIEEAAATLGAGRWTIFRRVVLPEILPALITGFALAFARGVGEYGSVIFIAGNMPFKSEIAPLLIVTKLEEYDYAGATAIATVLLLSSLALLLLINAYQGRELRRRSA
ncbi:MAG TPA: sulfate ABC transporter permease subunit CysT [Sphingomonas sp.]|uniref:sulfate ABC transporter permease subunit CysT n=1 Tax=Sphingomonas sp. TaxID=28214 RepID=UPI002CE954D8|nr:sulfate ABC transporter permease subunit CysT [Sphingomonas sp.]HMI20665.1 sulfate ABC transporter permease subunit CysT [Sphingomonas sp.]